ncbi:MAG: N-acetylmuramoyl-L-alanine amidase [Rhodothermales bacterium]|jgi:N-acetylmuramoyl-L-alanine amidase
MALPPSTCFRGIFVLLLLALIGTPDIAAQTAKPLEGEGIWSLLRRSGIGPTSALATEFRRLNASKLKSGDRLLKGFEYKLPGNTEAAASSAKVARQPEGEVYDIFGEEYELVQRKSNRLAGHVYYVVGGHGGPDPGTVSSLGGRPFAEDEIAYDTSLRLARRLLEEGAKVYIIVRDRNDGIRDSEYLRPDSDEYYLGHVSIPGNHLARLKRRTDIINHYYDQNRSTARSQQVISLHVDAFDANRTQPQIDVHFMYSSDRGRDLGTTLQAEFRRQYARHQPDRGYSGRVQRGDLYVLKNTKPTAVMIELGNIRHEGDRRRLVMPSNRQALAEWISAGLLEQASTPPNVRRTE